MRFRLCATSVLAVTVVATAIALVQTGARLTMNGKTLSNDLRVIGGRTYVPLADMARALSGKIVKKGKGYDIQTAPTGDASGGVPGGGTAISGTKGSIGQMVMTGKWSFEVVDVSRVASYASQYLPDPRTFAPAGPSEELVVIHCRLKNTLKASQMALLSAIHPHNTALADDQGQSHPLLGFDKRSANNDEGPNMLPGSLTDFAVIFSVPKDTKLKDLLFSLQTAYDDYPNGGTDLRISLRS
ncbi:MAG: hypothetical protein ACYC96_15000 [Fimbriimonadaceae bacterium]